jgi:hypothetical protein
MVDSRSQLNSRSAFDSFLFAQIGDDEKGMTVSVLSAFARLDRDPWYEAAELAKLPREVAAARLGATISALGGVTLSALELGTVTTRLVALLPSQTAVLLRDARVGDTIASNLRSPSFLISVALLMALGLASQFFASSLQPLSMAAASAAQNQALVIPPSTAPDQHKEPADPPTDLSGR